MPCAPYRPGDVRRGHHVIAGTAVLLARKQKERSSCGERVLFVTAGEENSLSEVLV